MIAGGGKLIGKYFVTSLFVEITVPIDSVEILTGNISDPPLVGLWGTEQI